MPSSQASYAELDIEMTNALVAGMTGAEFPAEAKLIIEARSRVAQQRRIARFAQIREANPTQELTLEATDLLGL